MNKRIRVWMGWWFGGLDGKLRTSSSSSSTSFAVWSPKIHIYTELVGFCFHFYLFKKSQRISSFCFSLFFNLIILRVFHSWPQTFSVVYVIVFALMTWNSFTVYLKLKNLWVTGYVSNSNNFLFSDQLDCDHV